MKLGTRHLLTLSELTPKELAILLRRASRLKSDLKNGRRHETLRCRSLVMVFQKPSTRTRVSFEIGMRQLGGHAVNLAASEMQLSRGETVEDTARTLSEYADCIMARVYEHETIERLAAHSDIPVINGLSDMFHPCQILADLMTIKERKKKLDGLRIAWIGDGNNVCNSMIYGAALAGASVAVATPKRHAPDKDVVREACKNTEVIQTEDPNVAVKGADVVMTDTFSSIHNKGAGRAKAFLPRYQVNRKLMDKADQDAIFMHCLPAKRGQEVTADVIDGPQSAVWDEAENRLHVQKALLEALIRK